jgi:nucleotide-binding universal stress UspA family protein
MAAGQNVELTLLNVIEEPLSFRTLDRVGQQIARKNERLALLERLAREEAAAGVSTKTLVCDGSPATEITRIAARNLHDMIIVGRHQHHGIGRWLHGHTASRLARQAPCPVMVLGN